MGGLFLLGKSDGRRRAPLTVAAVLQTTPYTVSSTIGPWSGQAGSGDGLRDGANAAPATVHGSNGPGFGAWIRTDLGSPKLVDRVEVMAVSSAIGGGWGPVYLNSATIRTSLDGSSWTNRATISGLTNTNIGTYPLGVTARYVEVLQSAVDYLAIGDFKVYAS